ncbi:hypothetical protein uan_105 [Pseudomonas phage UAntarctica]|nr:hypothetical protein uan_105 [Pseudomonas phage UAntarctica]
MAMSLTNLFNVIGDDGVTFHTLDQVFLEFKKRKGYNEVTFTTQEELNPQTVLLGNGPPMEKACFIVWFDRGHLQRLQEAKTPANLQLYKEQEIALRNLYLALKAVAGTPGQKVFEQDECLVDGLLGHLQPIFGGEG